MKNPNHFAMIKGGWGAPSNGHGSIVGSSMIASIHKNRLNKNTPCPKPGWNLQAQKDWPFQKQGNAFRWPSHLRSIIESSFYGMLIRSLKSLKSLTPLKHATVFTPDIQGLIPIFRWPLRQGGFIHVVLISSLIVSAFWLRCFNPNPIFDVITTKVISIDITDKILLVSSCWYSLASTCAGISCLKCSHCRT